jgi:pSer/pThr/pTyr-binding forkhead associated (FHA) protein
MPTQRLVIDGDDTGHFCLTVRDGTLTVGADPAQAGIVLNQLRVVRIHCEVELDQGAVVVGNDPTTPGAPERGQVLVSDVGYRVRPAQIRLVGGDGAAAPTKESAATQPAPTVAATGVAKRLIVVDGADLNKTFAVPETGRVAVGNSGKHAAVVLHDLYVARVHCELQVEAGRVKVVHKEGRTPTRVNGREVSEQELRLGDILRVGNSHLRYEVGEAEAAEETADEVGDSMIMRAPGRANDDGRPAPARDPDDPLLKLEGQALGQYQFGTVIGRGLSGVVFQAHHRQTNQAAAVKVISTDFPHGDAELQTFVRALKVAAPLRHPHVVTLYGAGKTGAYCWVAREYVEGESLADLTARLQADGKLGWKRACRTAVHLAQALEYLHHNKVAPGRFTPANVLVEQGSRITKLADVMLDQALHGSRLEAAIREKRQLATLPFTAPEQMDSGSAPEQRADLYALGAVLYFVMTGVPPFGGVSASEVSARIRDGKITKPGKTLKDIPAPFESAVLKLLSRRPEDRFPSATDLLAVVEPIAGIHEIKV